MPIKLTEAKLIRSLCRESYADFFKTFWSVVVKEPLIWNWHIELGCNELQICYERVFAGKKKEYDLLTNQPPGTTKSSVHSVMSVPWAWTRMPHLRFLGVSYSHTLAERLSMFARDVVKSDLYRTCFPEIELRSDRDTKAHWMNTMGGERFCAGTNGTITGAIHGHVISVDDAINPEKALSEAEMFAANHWLIHTVLNRKVDKDVTFVDVVGQRLAQGDPYDEFLKLDPKRVKHICIPADTDYEIKPPELIGFYKDGLMDPIRLSPAALEVEKAKGDHYYAGQFGQDPVPAGGGKIKTALLRWDRPPTEFRKLVRFWDKAVTPQSAGRSRKAAYTVGVKMGIDGLGRVWVLDVVRGRWDSFSRERVIRRTAIRDGRKCLIGIEQEPGSSGKDVAVATVRRLRGFRVRPMPASGSKESRVEDFSVEVNAGMVFLPAVLRVGNGWTGWAKEYVDELRYWPFSTYLDQGDSSGGAYRLLTTGHTRIGPITGSKKPMDMAVRSH